MGQGDQIYQTEQNQTKKADFPRYFSREKLALFGIILLLELFRLFLQYLKSVCLIFIHISLFCQFC